MEVKQTIKSFIIPVMWLLWLPASFVIPWAALAFPSIVLEDMLGIKIDAINVSIDRASTILMWLIPTTIVVLGIIIYWLQGRINRDHIEAYNNSKKSPIKPT